MSDKKKIILLEADKGLNQLLVDFLKKEWGDKYDIESAENMGAFMKALTETPRDQVAAVMVGDNLGGALNKESTVKIIRESGNFPILMSNTHEGYFRDEAPVGVYFFQQENARIEELRETVNRALNPSYLRDDGEANRGTTR